MTASTAEHPKHADENLSAYEKAASEGIDPRCIPQALDEDAPVGDAIPYPDYPEDDHRIWQTLFERQMQMLPGRASEAYFEGIEKLGMTPERLPGLAEMSARLEDITGWKLARVPGLLHERDFFDLLANRVFPSTDYIRGRDELDYTPAPDCFHDMFGHMPMLTEPAFADFYQLFGKAALKAEGQDRTFLETFHWFTVEFGLIREDDGLRIFGAGILSSKNEVTHALSDTVEVRDFDPETLVRTEYDVWHLQPLLYACDSFEALQEGFAGWTKSRGLL
jgi:phenylalanine-4-hydroxylase